MATTEHSTAVLTNSSVKPPLDPKSGLPNTFHERIHSDKDWENDPDQFEVQYYDEEYDQKPAQRRKHTYELSPRDPLVERLADDIKTMNDEEFLERLQELKQEHKKTLSMCERAYKTKITELKNETPLTNSTSRPPLHPSTNQKRGSAWADQSEDELLNHRRRDQSPELRNGSLRTHTSSLDRLSESMERIQTMWKDFDIEKYAPAERDRASREPLRSSSVISNKENETWSPVITIPKPFRMSIREANKEKKKTKNQEEAERLDIEQRLAEQAECTRKFKASPAPAHIYLPLYDEIQEKQETKRRLNHEYREELLRSVEAPFNFYQREEAKKRQRVTERSLERSANKEEKTQFKAKPAPRILDEDVAEKLAEEQEYRRIRVRMRAEELLRESKFPPSMDAREQKKQLDRLAGEAKEIRAELKRAALESEPSFRPRTNDVPNFERIHRKNARELANAKLYKGSTKVKPFNLRTERILSQAEKIQRDIIDDEYRLPEQRWPYKTSRTKPSNIGKLSSAVTSDDRMPSMTTQAAQLRQSQTKKRLTQEMRKELDELEKQRKRRQKEKQIKQQVVEKTAANDITYGLIDQTTEKLKRFREENRARDEEYRKSLREMTERVNTRPLLIESATEKNARQRAERKYAATLQRAGVKTPAYSNSPNNSNSPRYSRGVEYSDEERDSEAGSYRAPVRRRDESFNSNGSSNRSPGVTQDCYTRPEDDYSNTFTKEDTGLSDDDYSDRESIPDEILEMA